MTVNLRSDNEAPAAAEILAAVERANAGAAHAYGDDAWTARLPALFAECFERAVEVYPVATGTAANALCVAQMCPPYGAVLCHEDAHLYGDECGASEFYCGGKLLPQPGEHGKLDAAEVERRLAGLGMHGEHESRPAGLSLTQATECGTVYTPEEVEALATAARARGLAVHMDGARFANAVVGLGCTPAELTWKAGVDLLSFGATKNGALAAEAVVVFDPAIAHELRRRRKRGGHLLSKMRYVSAQLAASLEADLWLTLARRANAAAAELAEGLAALPEVALLHPVQANEVFVRLPEILARGLADAGFEFAPWPGVPGVYRMVTSHATEPEDVRRLVREANRLTAGPAG